MFDVILGLHNGGGDFRLSFKMRRSSVFVIEFYYFNHEYHPNYHHVHQYRAPLNHRHYFCDYFDFDDDGYDDYAGGSPRRFLKHYLKHSHTGMQIILMNLIVKRVRELNKDL